MNDINLNNFVNYNEENSKITVAVAMSGGVDSSTVAYLLKKQGYKVFGVTMKTCKPEDQDAKKVCDDLGIEHFLFDATKIFKKHVIDDFVNEYLSGRTPNPCMTCNKYVKFGALLEFAISKGANFMATGHYANLTGGTLAIGDDPNKDQVYFLSQIKKEYIKHLMFPIGTLEKPQVRELAKTLNIRVYSKKDSQEICFVDDGKLKEFLIENSNGKAATPGNIVTKDGKIVGKHNGISFYTIGQRKGLGISQEVPLYVISLNSLRNEVIVGSNEDLLKDKIAINELNFLTITDAKELETMELFAKTRSRDILHKCSVKVIGDDKVLITLIENKVRAVTPGQGLVLYDNENKVVASGFII